MKLLEVRDLKVSFGGVDAVRGISFALEEREKLAIIGESGSGKSVTALSVLALLPGAARRSGEILFRGDNLLARTERQMRAIRGPRIAIVFQDPMTSLNPVISVGRQIDDVVREHEGGARIMRRKKAVGLLEAVGIPDPVRCLKLYPHELSGGMRQRVLVAMAIACGPELLIADEPTTALDVTVQRQIVQLLIDLCDERGIGLLFISHNLDLVGEFCDRIIVMKDGRIVEQGEAERIFSAPAEPYTRHLLEAIPRVGGGARPGSSKAAGTTDPVLAVEGLTRVFPTARSAFARLFDRSSKTALRNANVVIADNEVIGIVGESGCGKTTLARMLVGLDRPTAGRVVHRGRPLDAFTARDWSLYRREVQLVFQGAHTSLNPRKTVRTALSEAMTATGVPREARRSPEQLVEMVRLLPDLLDRYPHQLSGGQRQRVGIARALSANPKILIADEPTSALDVSIQEEIIALLRNLQRELQMTMLVISHDLGLISSICDRVIVMKEGEIVERGDVHDVLNRPGNEYTRLLLDAVPRGLAGRGRFSRATPRQAGPPTPAVRLESSQPGPTDGHSAVR